MLFALSTRNGSTLPVGSKVFVRRDQNVEPWFLMFRKSYFMRGRVGQSQENPEFPVPFLFQGAILVHGLSQRPNACIHGTTGALSFVWMHPTVTSQVGLVRRGCTAEVWHDTAVVAPVIRKA